MAAKNEAKSPHSTFICVDSYRDGVPAGYVSDPGRNEAIPFTGTNQCLKEADRLMSGGSPAGAEKPERSGGKLATFAVNVACRKNESWQGTVIWIDRGREERFRSVLELNSLLDSALCASV